MAEEKIKRIKGWKTISGISIATIGAALIAGAKVCPMPELGEWLNFLGEILVVLGGGTAALGLAHKMEKNTEAVVDAVKAKKQE